ncbi:MAG: nuclear transport factor 2 family protein [Actinomycetota bacterium]|nr:nuclear transport factor 2 family protein [Actinomycetota bacterium]
MSQENVERVHRVYDAINRGDLEAMLALLHPEGEFIPRLLGLEGGGIYRGHDGVREWWQSIFSAFPDFNATVLEVRAVADATVSNVRFQGRGEGSGVPFEDTIWQVVRWRDGKAIWVKSYRDRADALEAAGLSE